MADMVRSNAPNTLEVYNVRKTLEFAKPKLVFPQFGAPDLIMKRKGYCNFAVLGKWSSTFGST